MSDNSNRRAEDFLAIRQQFQLGDLTTESSHPVTAGLSDAAAGDIAAGLGLLFEADRDVVAKYREFAASGRARGLADAVTSALRAGGRIFFTGCGSTGRLSIQLDSIWREFWARRGREGTAGAEDWKGRTFSVMAGGDFALIKSVEGFEDFTAFGRKQIADLGVRPGDVVFAITEGGETSFVIGTAWQGVEAGARVFFVYNNPDEVLRRLVARSREVIDDPRIEKINLTTGPMSITGSTRMQATSIQLCVMLTLLEMVARDLLAGPEAPAGGSDTVPAEFAADLETVHTELLSPRFRSELARLVSLEERIYRGGRRNNYFADGFGIDVLTDTTERSPTYCTPPFRKFDDRSATESWAFLFVPGETTPEAWRRILRRDPRCVDWTADEVRGLVPPDKVARTEEILGRIRLAELMRFRVGADGVEARPPGAGDGAVAVLAASEAAALAPGGWHRAQLTAARQAGGATALVCVGAASELGAVRAGFAAWNPDGLVVGLATPRTSLLLDGVTRVAVKLMLNALSTCTMVRLGRVMGNYMVWVVPSNLKLIDRATRYIQRLAGLDYAAANRLLFEVVEYVDPRMRADQAYPPVVGAAVLRARHGLNNEEAERRLLAG